MHHRLASSVRRRIFLSVSESLEPRCYMSVLTFAAPEDIQVGTDPGAIAVGSLRLAGLQDIVVANKADNSIEVLLNNGNGTFLGQSYKTGTQPDAVAIADFNEDGIPDIAVACEGDNSVDVFLGSSNGVFQKPLVYHTGGQPEGIAVGDFNNDGQPDIVTANFATNNVSIFYNNGSFLGHAPVAGQGLFLPQQTIAVGAEPVAVAVGEVSGNAQDDILTADLAIHAVSLLLANGNGTFLPHQEIQVGNDPESVAIGDVNGDGVPDLLAANLYDDSVSVLLGNGNGTFGAQTTFAVGGGPQSVALADLEGDGVPDLIVAEGGTSTTGGTTFGVLLGNGNGTFGDLQIFAAGPRPAEAVPGDFNGDGRVDIVTPDSTYNTVSIIYNTSLPFVGPTITDNYGIVSITGTNSDDTARLINNGLGDLVVTVDGLTEMYPMSSVSQIDVSLGGGDDYLLVEGGIGSVVARGGPGNDTIIVDNGASDTLVGNQGNDYITKQGFNGANLINGGQGDDTLLGGQGSDTLHGGAGNDRLVGGAFAGQFDGGAGNNVVIPFGTLMIEPGGVINFTSLILNDSLPLLP